MTCKQFKQIEDLLPDDEKFNRCYNAFEGGIRVISVKADNTEKRYIPFFDEVGNVLMLKRM